MAGKTQYERRKNGQVFTAENRQEEKDRTLDRNGMGKQNLHTNKFTDNMGRIYICKIQNKNGEDPTCQNVDGTEHKI